MTIPVKTFFLGGTITAILWRILWTTSTTAPIDGVLHSTPTPIARPRFVVEPGQTPELISKLNSATQNNTRLKIIEKLSSLSKREIIDALENMDFEQSRNNLSVAARTLLISFARKDPEAAINWAWANLRSSKNWPSAFREIGPEWAWNEPKTFLRLLIPHTDNKSIVPAIEAQDNEGPTFTRFQLSNAKSWLLISSPRHGFELQRHLGGFSSSDFDLIAQSDTTRDIEEALSAWDDFEPGKKQKLRADFDHYSKLARQPNLSDDQKAQYEQLSKLSHKEWAATKKLEGMNLMYVGMLTSRWKKLAPKEFANSRYTAWNEDNLFEQLDPKSTSMSKQTQSMNLLDEFQHWKEEARQHPDPISTAPIGKQQIWQDLLNLENLKPSQQRDY